MRIMVSSPTGRVGCNGVTEISEDAFCGFVPYGACGLQPKLLLLEDNILRVSSPTGRVGCNGEI